MHKDNLFFDPKDLIVLESYARVTSLAKERLESVETPAREKLKKAQQGALFLYHQKLAQAFGAYEPILDNLKHKRQTTIDTAKDLYQRTTDKAYLEREYLIEEAHRECDANKKKFKWSEAFATCKTKETAARDAYDAIERQAAQLRDETIAEAKRIFAVCLAPFKDIFAVAMEEAQAELNAEQNKAAEEYESEIKPALTRFSEDRANHLNIWKQYASTFGK
jgi:hypothetical protein